MKGQRVKYLRKLYLNGKPDMSFKKFKQMYKKLASQGKILVMEKRKK